MQIAALDTVIQGVGQGTTLLLTLKAGKDKIGMFDDAMKDAMAHLVSAKDQTLKFPTNKADWARIYVASGSGAWWGESNRTIEVEVLCAFDRARFVWTMAHGLEKIEVLN